MLDTLICGKCGIVFETGVSFCVECGTGVVVSDAMLDTEVILVVEPDAVFSEVVVFFEFISELVVVFFEPEVLVVESVLEFVEVVLEPADFFLEVVEFFLESVVPVCFVVLF